LLNNSVMKLKVICAVCFLLAVLIISCQSDEAIEFSRYYSSGSVIYKTSCQNCHGENGQGLAGLIPPITDSAYLKTNKASLACNVKYGLKGKVQLSNKSFDGEMPPVDLTPIEIAQVLTYVTNSFGNKLGIINGDNVQEYLGKCK
jgi:cytochrome c5